MKIDPQTKQDLSFFLCDFVFLMDQGEYTLKDNHLKNLNSLIELGITTTQRDKYIRSLTISNYYAGPKKDLYRDNVYWEFGIVINEIEVYIKLKIISVHGNDYAVCDSFHIAEFPMK